MPFLKGATACVMHGRAKQIKSKWRAFVGHMLVLHYRSCDLLFAVSNTHTHTVSDKRDRKAEVRHALSPVLNTCIPVGRAQC